MEKIVLVGAGNLATQLGLALGNAGHKVLQVYSRTEASAEALATRLSCEGCTSLQALRNDADIYIISLKDAVVEALLPDIVRGRENALFVHTAGSLPMDIFNGMARRFGVFYPMQTFSKTRHVDFVQIPCFIEADSSETLATLDAFAHTLSQKVYSISSEKRKRLHLSAVFACNFANHCYALAEQLLAEQGIPFEVMLPLIDETAAKVHALAPSEAQTGPAVRFDENVMARHLALLHEHADWQQIYRTMSESIHHLAEK